MSTFVEPRRALVVSAHEPLAATMTAALDRLGWPVTRAAGLAELETLGRAHAFEVVLVDVSLCAYDGEVPMAARRWLRRDALVLTVAAQANEQSAGAHLCVDGVSADDVVRLLSVEIDRLEQSRLLREAYRVASSPTRLSALPTPAAMQAATRLEWLVWNQPSLEEARRVVERQEYLAKQVVRLARALHPMDLGSAGDLQRVLLDLGLLRFMPLVKLVAARQMFRARDPRRAAELEAIFHLSVARATAMRWLAARLDDSAVVSASAAHDAGLFADAGASFLVWLADQNSAGRPPSAPPANLDTDIVGHHEWLGERLLSRWKAPATVVRVAAAHHRFEGPFAGNHAGLAAAAMPLLGDAGLTVDRTGAHDCRAGERVLQELNVSGEDRRRAAQMIDAELTRVQEAFVP